MTVRPTIKDNERFRGTTMRRSGLTLLETAVFVCIAGVVLASFLPTFFRHLQVSKIAEASEQLAVLHRLASAYYDGQRPTTLIRSRPGCLPPAAGPTPSDVSTQ